jgi:hypothetical protein
VIGIIAVSALDKPLALAFKLGVIGIILGVVLLAFGGLTGNQKIGRIGMKTAFLGVILWGITILYVFSWFFLH